MREQQTSTAEKLALIGKFTSEDRARKFGVRQTAQLHEWEQVPGLDDDMKSARQAVPGGWVYVHGVNTVHPTATYVPDPKAERSRNLQSKSTLRRLSELGQFGQRDRRRFPYEQMKKHPHRFDDSLWEQTIKNVRDGFPEGSKERAVMEDLFAPVFGLPYPESERFKTDGFGLCKPEASCGELAQKHGLGPSAFRKLLHQIRELNWAEYNRLSSQ